MIIHCPRGLGDAFYSYPVVRHYAQSHDVTVVTNYQVVFETLSVKVSSDYSLPPDIKLRYLNFRHSKDSQYVDLLRSGGAPIDLPFHVAWVRGFTDEFKRDELAPFISAWMDSRKNLCLVKEPGANHMHKKQRDFSMSSRPADIQRWIDENDYFYCSVGYKEVYKKRLTGIDYDLNDRLSVIDLITLAQMADHVVTQVGHLVPIRQAFGRPVTVFYPERITDSRLFHIKPHKIEL